MKDKEELDLKALGEITNKSDYFSGRIGFLFGFLLGILLFGGNFKSEGANNDKRRKKKTI